MKRLILFALILQAIQASVNNDGEDCIKKKKLEKMMKKFSDNQADLEARQKKQLENVSSKYSDFAHDFVGSKVEVGRDIQSETRTGCPIRVSATPYARKESHLVENCKVFNMTLFRTEMPTIVAAFTNGRLGNQMSSFATIYSVGKLSGCEVGIEYGQFSRLAAIFPNIAASQYLIEAKYCGDVCNIPWQRPDFDPHKAPYKKIINKIMGLKANFPIGRAVNLGSYLNAPILYKSYFDELRSDVFKIKSEYMEAAETAINEATEAQDDVILVGVHARYTDYRGHMKTKKSMLLGPKYYLKAMDYFRVKYSSSAQKVLFLVTSDDKSLTQTLIVDPQNKLGNNDVIFIGTVEAAVDGLISKEASIGTDLGILASCQHVIVSQGTFGMWGAFLASTTNEHIMGHQFLNDAKLEEVNAVKKAEFSNWLFMDAQ